MFLCIFYFFESYYLIFGILTLLLGFISKNLVKDKKKEFQIVSGVTGSLPISLISSYISYQAEILNELREHTVQFQEKAVTSGEAQIVTGNPVEPLIVFFILMISYNLPLLYDLIGTKDKPKVRYLSFYLIPIFIYILTPIILSNIA